MSQGSGLVLLFHGMGEHDGHSASWAFHKGGNGGFTQVLARAAQAFGAEIKLGAEVDHVITVERSGDRRRARRRHRAAGQGRRVGRRPAAHVHQVRRPTRAADRPRRQHASLPLPGHLVEGELRPRRSPEAIPSLGDRTDMFRGFTNIGPSMEYLERAFDEAKYGWYSTRPYIDGAIQSTIDPDMAPPGKHVMSCFIQYTPYHLKGSDWTTEREHMADNVQATLESFFPGFGDLVLQREIVTPLDIETVAGLPEGNIFHGEFLGAADVLLPPGARLEPVPHPDRRATTSAVRAPTRADASRGGPGRLASQQILGDLAG